MRFPPVLDDPVGPVKVGEHQDVEQLGAGSRSEGVEMFGFGQNRHTEELAGPWQCARLRGLHRV